MAQDARLCRESPSGLRPFCIWKPASITSGRVYSATPDQVVELVGDGEPAVWDEKPADKAGVELPRAWRLA
jgi:hypothetical protein